MASAVAAPALADDDVGKRLDALEQRVAHLEALLAQQQNQATPLVTLTRWSSTFKQGDLAKSYRIAYTLKSHCDKPVKLLDGSLDFSGPDGKRIYSVPLIREAHLDPGGEANFAGNYFVDPAKPEEIRLRDLPPEQIAIRLHLRRIVFRDNSVLSLD